MPNLLVCRSLNCSSNGWEPAPTTRNPTQVDSTLCLREYSSARAENLRQLHEAVPCLECWAQNARASDVLAQQVNPAKGCPLSVPLLTWGRTDFLWVEVLYGEIDRNAKKLRLRGEMVR